MAAYNGWPFYTFHRFIRYSNVSSAFSCQKRNRNKNTGSTLTLGQAPFGVSATLFASQAL